MRILAFDTTGAQCAVALWADGRLVDRRGEPARHGHAALLAPMIADILGRATIPAGTLDRIAVARGPGGFTGLRVGLATARGLALGTGAAIFAPTTFEALLLPVPASDLADADAVAVAVDSRLDALFIQLFGRDKAPLSAPAACPAPMIAALLPDPTARLLVIGDAAGRAAAGLVAAGLAVAATRETRVDVAALAQAAALGPADQLGPPMPLYVSRPAADVGR